MTWAHLRLEKNNGRPANPNFDPFWNELHTYLEEKTVVHERRHCTHMYMPFPVSVEDLRNDITKRLPFDTEIPSNTTIRLNIWPSNPYTQSAMKYTGR